MKRWYLLLLTVLLCGALHGSDADQITPAGVITEGMSESKPIPTDFVQQQQELAAPVSQSEYKKKKGKIKAKTDEEWTMHEKNKKNIAPRVPGSGRKAGPVIKRAHSLWLIANRLSLIANQFGSQVDAATGMKIFAHEWPQ